MCAKGQIAEQGYVNTEYSSTLRYAHDRKKTKHRNICRHKITAGLSVNKALIVYLACDVCRHSSVIRQWRSEWHCDSVDTADSNEDFTFTCTCIVYMCVDCEPRYIYLYRCIDCACDVQTLASHQTVMQWATLRQCRHCPQPWSWQVSMTSVSLVATVHTSFRTTWCTRTTRAWNEPVTPTQRDCLQVLEVFVFVTHTLKNCIWLSLG